MPPVVDVGAGGESGEARVQSRRRVRRFERAAPVTTGRAAQVRPDVSSTQAEVGSAIRKDDQYDRPWTGSPTPP